MNIIQKKVAQFVMKENYLYVRSNRKDEDTEIGEIYADERNGITTWSAFPSWIIEDGMTVGGFASIDFAALFCAQIALQENQITPDEFDELNDVRNKLIHEFPAIYS